MDELARCHVCRCVLGEIHGIVGEPGAMIDACIHLPLMTFTCNNNYKNIRTVLSNSAGT